MSSLAVNLHRMFWFSCCFCPGRGQQHALIVEQYHGRTAGNSNLCSRIAVEEVMSATGVEEMSLAGGGCHAWAFSASQRLGLDSTGSFSVENHPANSICLDMLLFSSSGIFVWWHISFGCAFLLLRRHATIQIEFTLLHEAMKCMRCLYQLSCHNSLP